MAHSEEGQKGQHKNEHGCCHSDGANGEGDRQLTADGDSYTCPMHPDIRSPAPGPCPKCGMALEPVSPMASAETVEYTCPMHPEIVRDKPGSCPICGMALEPLKVPGTVVMML